MEDKGVFYIAWNNQRRQEVCNSARSAKRIGLQTSLLTDNDTEVDDCFDFVRRVNFEDYHAEQQKLLNCPMHRVLKYLPKIFMYDFAPFDTNLYLDTDTLIWSDDISYGFEMAKLHGICGVEGRGSRDYFPKAFQRCLSKLSEEKREKWFPGGCGNYIRGINGGVVFFNKNEEVKSIFDAMKFLGCELGVRFELGLCAAIESYKFNPVILPVCWNCRPTFQSPTSKIKIMHFRGYRNKEANPETHDVILVNNKSVTLVDKKNTQHLTKKRINNVVFVHITKTGGGSIKRTIRVKSPHKTYLCLKRGMGEKLDHFFKFTFVRNPWDRIASLYFWRVQKNRSKPFVAFNIWLSKLVNRYKLDVDNDVHKKNKFRSPSLTVSQWKWLADEEDEINFDFIGRFENLKNDYKKVCDILGMPRKKKKLKHFHHNPHPHYTEVYGNKEIEIVRELCKKEINYFGYEFGQ